MANVSLARGAQCGGAPDLADLLLTMGGTVIAAYESEDPDAIALGAALDAVRCELLEIVNVEMAAREKQAGATVN